MKQQITNQIFIPRFSISYLDNKIPNTQNNTLRNTHKKRSKNYLVSSPPLTSLMLLLIKPCFPHAQNLVKLLNLYL